MSDLVCPACKRQTLPAARCCWCGETLAGPNRARKTDPDTAHKSARRSSNTRSSKDQAILNDLKAQGSKGGTTLEIASRKDLVHNNMSPRMVKLEEKRLIHRIELEPGKYVSRVSVVPRDMETKHESQIWYYGPRQPIQENLF
jgi:hypothetical protein